MIRTFLYDKYNPLIPAVFIGKLGYHSELREVIFTRDAIVRFFYRWTKSIESRSPTFKLVVSRITGCSKDLFYDSSCYVMSVDEAKGILNFKFCSSGIFLIYTTVVHF